MQFDLCDVCVKLKWHAACQRYSTPACAAAMDCMAVVSVNTDPVLGCMTPNLEAHGSGRSEKGPLLTDVVAAHNKQCLALCSMGLTHHLHQACYGTVLQQGTS